MTDETPFFRLVWAMRERQRQYYSRPIKSRLIAAKVAEKEVDDWIEKARGRQDLEFPEPLPPDEIPY